jgi:hypothetical protein
VCLRLRLATTWRTPAATARHRQRQGKCEKGQTRTTPHTHFFPGRSAELSKNLLRVYQESPGYWLAASRLVSYGSVPASSTPPNAKPCNELTMNIDRETGPATTDFEAHIEASDCTFDLGHNDDFREGGFPQAKYLLLRNLRVRYNGGSIGRPSRHRPIRPLYFRIYDQCSATDSRTAPHDYSAGSSRPEQLVL